MIAAYSLLVVVGLSDLLHSRDLSFPPTAGGALLPEGRWRRAVLIAAAAVITSLAALSSPWWALTGLLAGMALWLLSYRAPTQALGMMSTAIIAVALLAPSAANRLSSPGAALIWEYPLDGWQVYEWGLLTLTLILLNLATANRVVRMVLRFANADSPAPVEAAPRAGPTPRAGRVIGVLERYLLIALIVVGQGLAIAGIAAAKSIIRYPEISQTARDGEGLSAEVFFVGTVMSWLFAVSTVGLLFFTFW